MSRKRSEAAIRAFQRRFVEGAMARWPDVDEAKAERVWSMVVGFSGFGFPKAHGAAFGLLAYQSAWLREHYGPEFLCSLLDEQPMGFYPPDALTHEAQRRGIVVLAPDVNRSAVECTLEDLPPAGLAAGPVASPSGPDTPGGAGGRAGFGGLAPPAVGAAAVRLGLGYVLGVRADEVEALVAARAAHGPFRSLDDLASRAGAGRPALEQLAWSGACDALVLAEQPGIRPGAARRTALWRLGVAAPPHRAGEGTQLSLPLDLPAPPELKALDPWAAMLADYATTTVSTKAHPLGLLRRELAGRRAVSSADLERLPHGARVRIGGLVVARQKPGTAKGVVFLLLEDEAGTVNLIVPPPVYERDRLAVRTEPLVLAEGKLERHASAGGAINVLVDRIGSLASPGREDATVREIGRTAAPGDQEEAALGATGTDDFRAVAPAVMSFAQGRRR
jgi:error-prone DNA polymerase